MNNSNSILSMTEHGGYVWPSYAIAALVLVALVLVSLRALKRASTELARAEEAAPKVRDEA